MRSARALRMVALLLVLGAATALFFLDKKRHEPPPLPTLGSPALALDMPAKTCLAKVAKHRPEALAALRLKVPAREVADDDVTVVFWDRARAGGQPDAQPDLWVGGFWLGKNRACVLSFDAKANALVATSHLPRRTNGDDAWNDLEATTDAQVQAFELMRRSARFEENYDQHPVVPIEWLPDAKGLRVEYLDGWDSGCGHWSFGALVIDPSGAVVLGAHVM